MGDQPLGHFAVDVVDFLANPYQHLPPGLVQASFVFLVARLEFGDARLDLISKSTETKVL
eukprot:m.250446 g.250446  ORF g.250446 m.250446 type:complete len:60 (+) comp17176_c0_seq3:2412-2591(+)